MRTRTVIVVGVLLGTTALAACSGPVGDPVATANSTAKPTTSASAKVDDKEQALRFGQCMRDSGVPNFADPKFNDGGGMSIDVPEGADPAKVDVAMQKCKQYMPNGGEPQKLAPERIEQLRKFSQCMRDRGVRNFPDPTENGIQANGNDPGMNPNDPTFEAAQKECGSKYAPAPSGESPGTSGSNG
ncbi:hypothetical protein ACWENR_06985 [Micromonospora sp. NPDC004336]